MKKKQRTMSAASKGGGCLKRSVLRTVSLILMLLVVLSSAFVAFAVPENTTKIEKVTKTYDIAVVFDNSGSMYTLNPKHENGNNTRWCQAKYSMEIFASMLDYKGGDRLTIYTMWPVSVTGKDGQTSYKVEITSKDDIDKINKMYTVFGENMGTPYKPVEEATAALKNSDSKYEKWLIVLTDGDFNYEDREQTKKFDLGKSVKSRLSAIAETGINVQFLGLDLITTDDTAITTDNFYWDNAKASNLKDKLIWVCNMIFQRNELDTGEYLDDDELELEISMSKLVVFVQGNNKKSPVLKKSDGEVIPYYLDCGMRQYSEMKANKYDGDKAKTDKTLYGQVVTFENLPKGEYTLEYPGSKDKVKIFYEPDVTLYYEMKNRDGEVATPDSKELYPGEYTVSYSVVDRITGEDVTESELMGENGVTDLACVAEITNGDSTTKTPVKNNGSVELKQGDSVFLNISGTYLKNYKISTEDNKGSYTFNISGLPASLEFEVDAEVEQKGDWYYLKKRDEWKPVKVEIKYDGKALTDEEMAKVTPSFAFSPEVAYTYEMIPGESAYAVYIGKDKDGKEVDVATGLYKFTADAVYKDEYGREIKTDKPDTEKFEVQKYGKTVRFLIIILPILALIALILFIMSRKALPKDLIAERREFKINGRSAGNGKAPNYDRKGKTLKIDSGSDAQNYDLVCQATLSLYPVDRRWTPSRRRKVGINGISGTSSGVVRVKIDGTSYEKDAKGRFVQRLSPDDPIKEESSNPGIRIETKKSTFDCSLVSN